MKNNRTNLILGAGVTTRSGTNFLGSIFKNHPGISTIPPHMGHGEFPFFKGKVADPREKMLNAYKEQMFTKPSIELSFFRKKFGDYWLEALKEQYGVTTNTVFVKNPSIYNLERFYEYFPDGKLFILVRDGRDFVSSYSKASLLVRKSQPKHKKIRRFFKYHSGRAFLEACKLYKRNIQELARVENFFKSNGQQLLIIKYEDLLSDFDQAINKLFNFLELPLSEEEKANMKEAEVIGSSFYGSMGDRQKWQPMDQGEQYKSVGHWHKWGKLKKQVFKKIAGDELIKLGYESNYQW